MITEAPVKGDEDVIKHGGAVGKVANAPEKATAQDVTDALDWFLSPEPESDAADFIELNVGGSSARRPQKWVRFEIQALSRDRITEIRKESTRGSGPNAEPDAGEANLKIATEGLVNPDLSQEKNRVVRGQQYLSAADALAARFAHKSGLIDQLAGAIVDLSGYNDEDVREVRAAGN